MSVSPLATWHRIVADHDSEALADLIDDDAVFSSPALHAPQRGKALVLKYLRAALVVLATPSFTYVGEWHAERSAVLEFNLELDGLQVDGVDLIGWNDAGKITSFKVMIRPFKALQAVMARMQTVLQPVAR